MQLKIKILNLIIFILIFQLNTLYSQTLPSANDTLSTEDQVKVDLEAQAKADKEAKAKADKEAKKIAKAQSKAEKKYKKFISKESKYVNKAPKNITLNTEDPFVIGYVKYTSSNRTKEERVRTSFGSIEQMGFANEGDLVNRIEAYVKVLVESRYFASVRYEINDIVTQGNQQIYNINVIIEDSPVVLPVPYALYNTSTGFSAAFISPFPNIGGELFDFIVFAGFRAPPNEDRSLNFDNPEIEITGIFERIKVGPVMVGTRFSYFDKGVPLIDRGEKVLEYKAKIFTNETKVEWEFTKNWYIYNMIYTSASFDVSDVIVSSPDKKYQMEAYRAKFEYLTGIQYLGAPLIETALKGHQAKFLVGYSFFDPYAKDFSNIHSAIVSLKYGFYDRIGLPNGGKPFYYPSVEAEFYYNSGKPDYTLGRYWMGIFDPLMSGNGVFVVTHASMFGVARIPKKFEFQMGPLVSYGISWDDNRAFEVYDQGFTVGLKLGFIFDMIPNIPIYLILAEDLRKRPEPANFWDRFELQFVVSYIF